MTTHAFGALITHHGIAANNRGETDGNVTTLQKLLWNGRVHTTVSAEAIRFGLRRLLAEEEPTNRVWNEETRANEWHDADFATWNDANGEVFADDDLFGFMSAQAAREEGTSGKATVRRAVLEVTRAISLTPWGGDVTFNAASIGATPSAARKGSNPVPYGTEVHATRYQYGFALTPERLRKPTRAASAIRRLCALGTVAGNHGRFLFDFSPEAVIFRVSSDPAPRILYVFELVDGTAVDAPVLVRRAEAGDIDPSELILGGTICDASAGRQLEAMGATVLPGVVKAAEETCARLEAVS